MHISIDAPLAIELNRQEREVVAKLDRLYDALSDGTVKNTGTFQNKVDQLEAQREDILRQKSQTAQHSTLPSKSLAKKHLTRFTEEVHAKLRDENPEFRRAYVRQFVGMVEVSGSEIRITGPKAALAGALAAHEKGTHKGVPSFVQEWWAVLALNQ